MNVRHINRNLEQAGCEHRFTRHATNRMQQRGIPEAVTEAAIKFGSKQHVSGDAVRYDLDRRALRRARGYFGPTITRALEEYDGIYVIVASGNTVVTAAHSH